jgi:hypothetical protein
LATIFKEQELSSRPSPVEKLARMAGGIAHDLSAVADTYTAR